ncbi:MAG: hypothetical protein R8G34_10465 [Paracoccaceae bacterium]|nr:hypothetical protein [Paracoccaceae bacterium]
MTSPPAPKDFDTLRRSAIGFAQAASGNIWTDYNLHDPGVTLLEQTCFALSEVSFQAVHSTADLLTNDRGDIRFNGLSLFLPSQVLPGDPVTMLDLATELTEVDGISRVLVSRGPRSGLFDAVVIPARSAHGETIQNHREQAKKKVRTAFRSRRPLACDLNRLYVAKRMSAMLTGSVKITATAIPERVAAEIYFHVSAILRGQAVGHRANEGATRQTVYDHPQAFLHAPSDQDSSVPNLEDYLADFREIPGVIDVSTFSLSSQPITPRDGEDPAEAYYLDLTLPETVADIELELTLDDVPLKLDPSQILEEFVRVSAEHIAQAQHHLKADDWLPPTAGQRRNFDQVPVDALLPGVYVAGAKTSTEASLLARYRSAVNAHLAEMSGTLRDLPAFLTATTDAASDDPAVQRHRVDLLDYLIAHQGEEMPVTRHAGLHTYRSAADRAFFDIRWRLDFLAALPYFNRGRGTGPDGEVPGAFLAKFRLLADLDHHSNLAQEMVRFDLSLQFDNEGFEPDYPRNALKLPDDPFDMLVPHDPVAQQLPEADLLHASPWIVDGKCSPDLFLRAADPRSFIVSRTEENSHAVFFDSGDETHLYLCEMFPSAQAAKIFTQRMRASWRAIHANSEGAFLIEDILLRSVSSDFSPNTATLVLTGWTARSSQPTYRAYVERLIETLSPAHLRIVPYWLSQPEMARFEVLHERYLQDDADAKRELRALLSEGRAVT